MNIDKIIFEIREKIEAEGNKGVILDFEDVPYEGGGCDSDSFDLGVLDLNLNFANNTYFIEAYRPLNGNKYIVFIKKAIRKLTKFYVEPVVKDQVAFNAYLVRTLNMIRAYIVERQNDDVSKKELLHETKVILARQKQLEKQVEALNDRVKGLKKENIDLKNKLEEK